MSHRTAPNIPVLMYHHVSPSKGALTTSPENFARQMGWLARNGWQTLSADEFASYLRDGRAPSKSVVLSFDDGYLDNWVYAHPVLKEHGFKAWMFLVTAWVGDGAERAHAGRAADGVELPVTPGHQVCKAHVAAGEADAVIVRWSEIDAMVAAGTFEFHSHTHTHTRWDLQCADAVMKRERLAQDLAQSRWVLGERLGAVSEHLCWPQGYFDDDYVGVAEAAGFRYLYTTDARGQNQPAGDPSHIYRVGVKNRGALLFGQRVWLARSPWAGPLYNSGKDGSRRVRDRWRQRRNGWRT